MEGLARGRSESTQYYLDALVEHHLGLLKKGFVVAGVGLQLAAI